MSNVALLYSVLADMIADELDSLAIIEDESIVQTACLYDVCRQDESYRELCFD